MLHTVLPDESGVLLRLRLGASPLVPVSYSEPDHLRHAPPRREAQPGAVLHRGDAGARGRADGSVPPPRGRALVAPRAAQGEHGTPARGARRCAPSSLVPGLGAARSAGVFDAQEFSPRPLAGPRQPPHPLMKRPLRRPPRRHLGAARSRLFFQQGAGAGADVPVRSTASTSTSASPSGRALYDALFRGGQRFDTLAEVAAPLRGDERRLRSDGRARGRVIARPSSVSARERSSTSSW